jgi:L-histidine N-alpha-methyltransferase
MSTSSTTATHTIDVHLDTDVWLAAQADAARRTLAATPPSLDPVWFYDEHGSELFDAITRLPEYYPTRTERALLIEHAPALAALGVETLVELGSGTSDKTTELLDAMVAAGALRTYVPFDVSEETLRDAVDRLSARYPSLEFHGIVGDFHRHLDTIPAKGRRLVAFLGSTLGNLRPAERRRFLTDLDCTMNRDDHLLLGVDLVKGPDRLVAAYDDAAGVTAEFNRNALRVLNARLGTDFDVDGFEHHAVWVDDEAWIEMRLRARTEHVVSVPGLDHPLRFAPGDELRTEISAKFTVDTMTAELWDSGFVLDQAWTAPGNDFALLLAHPYC